MSVRSTGMAASSSTVLLASASSAAILIALYARRRYSNSKPEPKTVPSSSDPIDVDIAPDDCIQPGDIIAIFEALFVHMQKVIAQLSQQVQQIQMSGQSLPEKQLRDLLTSEFERALMAQQTIVLEEHNVDEECLREATWKYLEREEEYPKIAQAVKQFQKLYEQISGKRIVGIRPGDGNSKSNFANVEVQVISKETLLKAAAVYFDALTYTMKAMVEERKEKQQDLKDKKVAEKLHLEFAAKANLVGEKALEQMGVSLEGFQTTIQKLAQDPEVGQTLAMLQMKQQQEFLVMGVPAM